MFTPAKVYSVLASVSLILVGLLSTAPTSVSAFRNVVSVIEVVHEDREMIRVKGTVPQPSKEISCDLYAHGKAGIAKNIGVGNPASGDCFGEGYIAENGEVCLVCHEAGGDDSCTPCGGGFCMDPE